MSMKPRTPDERIDPTWDGPAPRYETVASVGSEVTREELVVYFSHVIAQVIDLACELQGQDCGRTLDFPEGSIWNRDWSLISSCGMTETEVSFLLSDIDGDALRNMTNLALGVALDKTLADCGPVFMTYVASTLLGIVAHSGEATGTFHAGGEEG